MGWYVKTADFISLNGYLYLADKHGDAILFETKEVAIKYLREHGQTEERIKNYIFEESEGGN